MRSALEKISHGSDIGDESDATAFAAMLAAGSRTYCCAHRYVHILQIAAANIGVRTGAGGWREARRGGGVSVNETRYYTQTHV